LYRLIHRKIAQKRHIALKACVDYLHVLLGKIEKTTNLTVIIVRTKMLLSRRCQLSKCLTYFPHLFLFMQCKNYWNRSIWQHSNSSL